LLKNVFFGVFQRNFPPELVRQANTLLLDQVFIRFGLNITYTIADGTYISRTGQQQKFVRLMAVARYKVKNVGNAPADLPISIGLPNPLINEMKSSCKVNEITLERKNGEVEKPNLSEAEKAFRTAMADDSKSQVKFALPSVSLKPDDDIEVVFNYEMAKEEEDTEIFQTLYPADSLVITVIDRGPTVRAVRARSIHVSELEDDTSAWQTGAYNFKLLKYLLPHQGFVIWWKKVPNEQKDKPEQLTKDLNVN
jgi:hypothetical protein